MTINNLDRVMMSDAPEAMDRGIPELPSPPTHVTRVCHGEFLRGRTVVKFVQVNDWWLHQRIGCTIWSKESHVMRVRFFSM